MKRFFILLVILFLTTPCFAHSGRLDNKGGHKVSKEWIYIGKYLQIKNNKPELRNEKIIFNKGSYHYHCKPSLNKINYDTYRDGIYIPVKDTKEVVE